MFLHAYYIGDTNTLSGTIPTELSALVDLRHLGLSEYIPKTLFYLLGGLSIPLGYQCF